MSDLPTWARVLIYGAGAIAAAVVLYAVVYLAVRAALRASQAEQRAAARRQEDLLRGIATSAEYVADVADAWAEGEAARRSEGTAELNEPPPAPREPVTVKATATVSSSAPDHDHAGAGQGSD
ncbi:MAG TPA: hypothetical protein VHZ96_12280 [Frankiaceae bacterium]|nr:hypothetical protein [Frankiaceae bacterium]